MIGAERKTDWDIVFICHMINRLKALEKMIYEQKMKYKRENKKVNVALNKESYMCFFTLTLAETK